MCLPKLPVDVFGGGEAEEGLIHKCRRLQRVSGPLTPKTVRRDLTQVRHQQLEEPGFSLRVARAPLLEQ